MTFDLSDFHVIHVLAAYATAAVLIGGLMLFSLRDYLRAKRGK